MQNFKEYLFCRTSTDDCFYGWDRANPYKRNPKQKEAIEFGVIKVFIRDVFETLSSIHDVNIFALVSKLLHYADCQ